MGTKYIVGPKASFVNGGRVYKPGDEIDGELFDKKALDANLKGGRLLSKAAALAAEALKNPPPAGPRQAKKLLTK